VHAIRIMLETLCKFPALTNAPVRRPHCNQSVEISHRTVEMVANFLRTRPMIGLVPSNRATHTESAFGSLIYIELPMYLIREPRPRFSNQIVRMMQRQSLQALQSVPAEQV
jgi:hypothetical protein